MASFLICAAASFFTLFVQFAYMVIAGVSGIGIIVSIIAHRRAHQWKDEICLLQERYARAQKKAERAEEERERAEEKAKEQESERAGRDTAVDALGRQCHYVSAGEEVSRRLTSIVKEQTEAATLQLTNKVYTILEESEELNSTIQNVIGGLSAEESGLKYDVQLIEEEQEKVRHLIEEFVQIRDGYTQKMKSVESLMKSIEGFVGSINDIADRTNMLAIRTSIEAAKAGEAGGGFAVIGSDIQKLSKNSMDIAEQITSTIQETSAAVSSSVQEYGEKIDSAVEKLEKSGGVHSELIEKLTPQIDNLTDVVNTSRDLSSSVHGHVDEMARQLQYQDRIQQIISHLIQFLEEMGTEAAKTACSYVEKGAEEQEEMQRYIVEKAAKYFSTDEEFAEFGYEREKAVEGEKKVSETDTRDDKVVLF